LAIKARHPATPRPDSPPSNNDQLDSCPPLQNRTLLSIFKGPFQHTPIKMARISALIIAAATAIIGVQAGTCPHNGLDSFFCGSELLDVYKCQYRVSLEVVDTIANIDLL
jgi:hypothetical protein